MPASIPSLRFHFLTPYYDFLFRLLLPEKKIRQKLLHLGNLTDAENILEIGCGTGSFTLMLAAKFPDLSITAVDPDRRALSILSAKIAQKSLSKIKPVQASATALPLADESVQAVFSSLLFCNLSHHQKIKTIMEARRVLQHNGRFLIAEWGKPQTFVGRLGFTILQWVGGKANTNDIKKGALVHYLISAKFSVSSGIFVNTLFGTVWFYEVAKTNHPPQEL